jgi:hypothetical protein
MGPAPRPHQPQHPPLVELPAGAAPAKTGRSLTVEQATQFIAAASDTELEAM